MKHPRFEIVRTDAGHHVRMVGGNGEIVYTTEVYTRRAAARDAVRFAAKMFSITPAYFTNRGDKLYAYGAGVGVEVRDVDERTPEPAPLVAEPPFHLGTYTHHVRVGRRVAREYREFWHDSDYHWRHCTDQDGCPEGTPPTGAEVRVRAGNVTYAGGA